MDLTPFERLAIADLIGCDTDFRVLAGQLEVATVRQREFTGCGVFVHLAVPESAQMISKRGRCHITGNPRPFLRHPELEHGAMAVLWLEGGVIDCLEMCTFVEDWPSDDHAFQLSHDWPPGYF